MRSKNPATCSFQALIASLGAIQCQGLGHMARVCRHKTCCGWRGSHEHTDDKECPKLVQAQPARCTDCEGDHAAWAGQCPVRQEAATRARAFITRPTQFAEDHYFPSLSCQIDEPRVASKRKLQSGPGLWTQQVDPSREPSSAWLVTSPHFDDCRPWFLLHVICGIW